MVSIGLYFGLAAMATATTQTATAPATAPTPAAPAVNSWMYIVFGLGVCSLAVWILRRVARPGKLSLRNTPGRPNTLTPIHLVVLFTALVGLGLGQELLPHIESAQMKLASSLVVQLIWLGLLLVVARFTFRHGLVRGLGLSMRHWIYDTGRGVLGCLAAVPICLLLFWMIPRSPEQLHPLLKQLPELSVFWKSIAIITAVIVGPIAEEVFFRGLVQSMFRRYFGSPWVGIVAASIMFALVHEVPQDWAPLFVLSIVLGYNYERCGRLYPVFLIHAVFNAINIANAL